MVTFKLTSDNGESITWITNKERADNFIFEVQWHKFLGGKITVTKDGKQIDSVHLR